MAEAFDVHLWRREGKSKVYRLGGQSVVVGPLLGAREQGSRQSLATGYQIVLADANVFNNPYLSSPRPPANIRGLLPS